MTATHRTGGVRFQGGAHVGDAVASGGAGALDKARELLVLRRGVVQARPRLLALVQQFVALCAVAAALGVEPALLLIELAQQTPALLQFRQRQQAMAGVLEVLLGLGPGRCDLLMLAKMA